MSCIYNQYQDKCELFNEGIERPGASEEGYCICDNDVPEDTCEDYNPGVEKDNDDEIDDENAEV
jgi:hypothetical protein